MSQELEKIFQQKKQTKIYFNKIKNKCIAIIYDGFVHNKAKKNIFQELWESTVNKNKATQFIYNNSKILMTKINKMIDKREAIETASIITGKEETQESAMAILFLLYFNRFQGQNIVAKGLNAYLDSNEAEEKDKLIKNIIKNARDDSMIFYLASEHEDCAKDHKDFQGRIYIDENWRNYTKNQKVYEYVAKHNPKTVQWVISSPVWFITRPNCRHYFKQIKTDEVLNNSRASLIIKYNMHKKVGSRGGLQTLSHPRNATWYQERKNLEGIISKYEDRLAMHKEMAEKFRIDDLKNMINKDKLLIKKWKNYLKEQFA